MTTRIGLMGFGRIGRNVFRIVHERDDVEVAAIVDIAEPQALEYLLRFDTVHGRFEEPVWIKGDSMYAKGRRDQACSRPRRPATSIGRRLGVDIVVEATGQYRTRAILREAPRREGAKCVVLTVPPRDPIDALVVMGVNDHVLTRRRRASSATRRAPRTPWRRSARSWTTPSGSSCGFMTTVHAYTNDQRLADVPHTEMRRSRAAAENIIPTETHSPQVVAVDPPAARGKARRHGAERPGAGRLERRSRDAHEAPGHGGGGQRDRASRRR